ncbi:MAG TPA: hypothetical protein VFI27_05135 [candidate division Zixibacteria bacterium]|nr:hypothetical protein [candidate division Zixibacteria bacterium]
MVVDTIVEVDQSAGLYGDREEYETEQKRKVLNILLALTSKLSDKTKQRILKEAKVANLEELATVTWKALEHAYGAL